MVDVPRDVECTCCGTAFVYEQPIPWEDHGSVVCPVCGSYERHRLFWFFFEHEGRELLQGPRSFLHFAPEPCLVRRLAALTNLDYLTADIRQGKAMEQIDIRDIAYENDRFDVILCSCVLDHVDDDRRAMRELCRVLKPRGTAILHVPGNWTRAETYEDPSIVSPEERLRAYGAVDHVRRYGRDIVVRLAEAGFTVQIDRYVRRIDRETVRRHWMRSSGTFVCTKR